MSKEFDVYVGHGPCIDGQTSLAIAWSTLHPDVQAYLAKFGGFYAENKGAPVADEDAHPDAPHALKPEMALKIMQGWDLKDHEPKVFVTCHPSTPLPVDLIKGKRVLLMDLDPGTATLKQLREHTKNTFLIDHHASFRSSVSGLEAKVVECETTALADNLSYYWDPRKQSSGASLTWTYFNPDVKIPTLIEMVQIGDTWSWKQNPELKVRECMAALYRTGTFTSFPAIMDLVKNLDKSYETLVTTGRISLDLERSHIVELASKADLGVITSVVGDVKTNYNILYTSTPLFANSVCVEMRTQKAAQWAKQGVEIHFCANWKYKVKEGIVTVSLRSNLPGLRLGEIARGIPGVKSGGGHDAAAAFIFEGIHNFHTFIQKPAITVVAAVVDATTAVVAEQKAA
ncbi:Hypothetical protein POVN_LOCUS220 [uncultured virus]|nr:Hypothetical protein POVN_LOCUS220 [uncultured virus]